MRELEVKPGDVVVTDFGVYQHWSIVTDKLCELGLPMLISATKRNHTVKEEPWNVVTQGRDTYVVEMDFSKPVSDVLRDARSRIEAWPYSVTTGNCEHFVKWAANLEIKSTQVVAAAAGAIAGVVLVGIFAKKPNIIKFLEGAFILKTGYDPIETFIYNRLH